MEGENRPLLHDEVHSGQVPDQGQTPAAAEQREQPPPGQPSQALPAQHPPATYVYGQPYPTYGAAPGFAGQPYYAGPPLAGLPAQQQQVITVQQRPPVPVVVGPTETYDGAVVYSLVVTVCCNLLFGIIGYILAVSARDAARRDPQGARKLGIASYSVSTAGIVVTIIVIAVVIGVAVQPSCVGYLVNGVCYDNKACYVSRADCGDYPYFGFFYHGCCYYDD